MNQVPPRALIVDDDPLICDTLRFVLANDYRVRTAANRPEAIALATSVEFRPQLALVDLGLPPHPHRPDACALSRPHRDGGQPRLALHAARDPARRAAS